MIHIGSKTAKVKRQDREIGIFPSFSGGIHRDTAEKKEFARYILLLSDDLCLRGFIRGNGDLG